MSEKPVIEEPSVDELKSLAKKAIDEDDLELAIQCIDQIVDEEDPDDEWDEDEEDEPDDEDDDLDGDSDPEWDDDEEDEPDEEPEEE